jgi:hypothetical protein
MFNATLRVSQQFFNQTLLMDFSCLLTEMEAQLFMRNALAGVFG